MNSEKLYAILDCQEIFDLYEEFEETLRSVNISGATTVLWFSFMEMMNVLFAFLRSVKIGNWELHLQATRDMLPWFFGYDHQNYSRYLTYYWVQMSKLPETHPSIHNEFR